MALLDIFRSKAEQKTAQNTRRLLSELSKVPDVCDAGLCLQLIEDGVHVNARDWDFGAAYMRALHYAARNGQNEIVSALIDKGADVNATSSPGTPLMIAVRNFHMDIARILLENGADPNYENTFGSPLIYATAYKDPKMTQLLLDHGGKITKKLSKFRRNNWAVDAVCKRAETVQTFKNAAEKGTVKKRKIRRRIL
ncbi:MAG: ankyrin repeat domain-containing protein [Alphaproteobacteria bacterium]|nr:ankyrin repeat domain-containing protein [Alphaproteobacteria bacterium]